MDTANELRYINTVRRCQRNITVQRNEKLTIWRAKIFPFVVNFRAEFLYKNDLFLSRNGQLLLLIFDLFKKNVYLGTFLHS